IQQRLAHRSRPSPSIAKNSTGKEIFANGLAVADVGRSDVDTSAFGGPRLLQRDLIRMFSQSQVSLGFATAGESHLAKRRLTHLRLQEFEAPMSGALYLTEDQPELGEYFESGT